MKLSRWDGIRIWLADRILGKRLWRAYLDFEKGTWERCTLCGYYCRPSSKVHEGVLSEIGKEEIS